MVFYRGTGIWVILIIGIVYNTALFANTKIRRLQAPDEWGSWLYIVIFSLSAVLLWSWGHVVNRGPEQVHVDPKTGEKIPYKPKHDCFKIGFKPWAYIMAALAAVHVYCHFF